MSGQSAVEGPDCPPLNSNGYVSHHSVSESTVFKGPDSPPLKGRTVRHCNLKTTATLPQATQLKNLTVDSPPLWPGLSAVKTYKSPETLLVSDWALFLRPDSPGSLAGLSA